jgi:energy-coupling factor transport system substrate-specific component
VSWQLVSFLILGGVLVAGFTWYERSRPPSQVVALVAALAALAIAGRIAFAAFPNLKPTTDIVIFAGYALGGAPGFAVGALAALVSNFWFGQGPWTPWQMAGWGLCGILGAALALGVRNAGRLSLAATCGLAAIAYGALLNFSLMATYGGDLSWRQFGVLEVRAIPFEIAHFSGNVVLALLAGPAMVRMLTRFRERFEWRRGGGGKPAPAAPPRLAPAMRGGGLAVLALLCGLGLAVLTPARADASDVSRGADWLVSVQNGDGGFGSAPGDDSGPEMTCWAMLGLEAAGRNPLDVARAGRTPVDFLRGALGTVKSSGDLARTILALEGAGVDPRQFGGQNLVAKLLDRRLKNGSFENWPNSTAFAAIALRAAAATGGLDRTMEWLRSVQNDDGGWGDTPGSPSNADGTGAVLQAIASGSKASKSGLEYLKQAQVKGGGFPLGGNGAINTQSTAWAIEGLLAAGGDPASYRRGGAGAAEYLANHQDADGHYRYSGASDQTPVWVTGEVLVAAANDHYPVSPPPREPQPKLSQSAPIETGGVPPSTVSPSPDLESPVVPNGSSGGGAGSSPGHPAPSGQGGSGQRQSSVPPGVASGGGSGAFAPGDPLNPGEPAESTVNTKDSELVESSDNTTAAGAIITGLLVGVLLFGVAWTGRKVWMRQRYGV